MTAARLPEYQRIADELRARIRRNEVLNDRGEPIDRLPSENVLAAQYGVAPQTMRAALDVLKHEGLIVRRPKIGSVINRHGKLLRDGPGRLRDRRFLKADVDDRPVRVTELRSGVRKPRKDESLLVSFFGPRTSLVYRERVYELEGQPVSMATSFMPQWLFQDGGERVMADDTGPGGIWGRLEDSGHRVVEGEELLEFRPANSYEVAKLKLSAGSWVVVITRPAEDEDGEVVDLAVITLPASRWLLRYPVL